MKFSIKDFLSKCDQIRILQWMWPNPQDTADLVTFTEEIINRKLHFLCSLHKTLMYQPRSLTPWLRLKRRKLNVLGVFWTSYVRSSYVLYAEGTGFSYMFRSHFHCTGNFYWQRKNYDAKNTLLWKVNRWCHGYVA